MVQDRGSTFESLANRIDEALPFEFSSLLRDSGPDKVDLVQDAQEAKGIEWHDDILGAYDLAVKLGKPLVVLFSTDWCDYCKALEKHVLTDEKLSPYASRAIFVRGNPEVSADADGLKNSFNVELYPTMVVMDATSTALTERGRIVGYHNAFEYVRQLESSLPSSPSVPETSFV